MHPPLVSDGRTLPAASPDPACEVGQRTAPRGLADQRYHGSLLLVSLGVLALSVVLTVSGETQVIVPVLNRALPEVCSFKRVLGLDCPGCGLTRCFISLAHGRVWQAFQFSPVGVVFFGIVAGQVPYRALQIARLRRGLPEWRLGWFGYWLLVLVAAGLIVQWVVKLSVGSA